MRKINFSSTILEYNTEKDLLKNDFELLHRSKRAAKDAYAVYSDFHVGAAVRLSNGEIYTGNNQENAAYPSGLCAERVALFGIKSQYPKAVFDTIAISAYSSKYMLTTPISPCGGCLQVIAEYEKLQQSPIRLILASEENGLVWIVEETRHLLPHQFELILR